MMGFEIIVLWSDMLIWLLVAAGIGGGVLIAKNPPLLAAWRRVGASRWRPAVTAASRWPTASAVSPQWWPK